MVTESVLLGDGELEGKQLMYILHTIVYGHYIAYCII